MDRQTDRSHMHACMILSSEERETEVWEPEGDVQACPGEVVLG